MIYTVLLCTTMAGQTYCQLNSSMTFQSLVECQQYQGMSRPIGSDGRTVLYSKDGTKIWWQCAGKRVDAWQLQ